VQSITVRALATQGVVRPSEPIRGNLHIESADGAQRHDVSLTFVPGGPALDVASTLDFGTVSLVGPTLARDLELRNTGTERARFDIAIVGDPEFALNGSTTFVELAAGQGQAVSVALRARSAGTKQAEVRITPDSILCNLAPASISVAASVSGEPISITPGTLDFGDITCGQAPSSPKTVSITNYGGADLMWTATLDAGASSAYEFKGAAAGTISTDATGTIDIAALTNFDAGPGPAEETLVVAAGSVTLPVTLMQNRVGGVISFPQPSDFTPGRKKLGTSGSFQAGILNSGNAPVTLALALTGSTDFSLSSTSPITVPANSTVPITFGFSVSGLGDRTGHLATSTSDALCGSTTPNTDVALYGFGRATQAWGFGLVLDDGSLWQYGSLAGKLPAGAMPFSRSLDEFNCYRPSGTDVPTCAIGSTTFVAKPEWAGMREVAAYLGLLDDGTVVHVDSRTPVSGLSKNVKRLVVNEQTDYCVLLDSGTVECWGGTNLIANVRGVLGAVAEDARYQVPNLSGVLDIAVSGRASTLCAILGTGKVRCWGLAGVGSVTNFAEPSDNIKLFAGRYNNEVIYCMLRSSKLVSCGAGDASPLVQMPVTGVVDLAFHDYSSAYVLEDGRVVAMTNYLPQPPVAVPGLD
jgi:hypothetical protein